MQIDLEKRIPPPLVDSVCTECGAVVPSEIPSCDALLQEILMTPGRDPGTPPPRLAIDAFAMQHPRRYCKSAKSYAAHLAGLCCGIEFGGSDRIHAAIQKWLNGPADRMGVERPEEPAYPGKLTVRHLYGVDAGARMEFLAREWALDVWTAYESQHEIARRWVETALARR